jgi:5-methylcytosine-specific restriction enzyme A
MPNDPRRLNRPRGRKPRGTTSERGYGSVWQRFRKAWLDQEPRFCADCAARGRVVPASHLDHIKPHKGNSVLFWDRENLQGLCATCHSVKTANEDGGFGRPVVETAPEPPCSINELFLRLRDKAGDHGRADVENGAHGQAGEHDGDEENPPY